MSFFNDKKEREIKKISFLKFLEGLFIGLSIGTIIGVFLAPKSGKETLSELKENSSKLKEDLINKKDQILKKDSIDIEQ